VNPADFLSVLLLERILDEFVLKKVEMDVGWNLGWVIFILEAALHFEFPIIKVYAS
jgi:hypothetical protein